MPLTLGELLAAAVSGGLGAKALDFLHDEWKRRSSESRSARKVVEQHLDPILKSGDELAGKIRSLARSDFKPLSGSSATKEPLDIEFLGTLYLFAQFWSWLQILRRESVYVVISSVASGRYLHEFMRTLEATRVRLVSRTVQRGIGEALIENAESPRVISLHEFQRRYQLPKDFDLQRWLDPVEQLLMECRHTSNRQRVLTYGAVIHAMLDTLDPEHKVTRERSGWANKLSLRSRKELELRVFRNYLPFVERPHRYTRPG